MFFSPKKEIIIFLALFLAVSVGIFIFLNNGAYLEILRYKLSSGNAPILDFKSASATAAMSGEKDYALFIPKIGVLAPVVFPKDDSVKNILLALKKGVALYPGSSLPGDTGRGVILGHSSKPPIFTLLNKLQKDDEFYVVSGNKKFVYSVFANDTLSPEKTNATLSQLPKNKSEIALITCWPIGSSSKRTLIQTKLIGVENF